MSDAVYMMINKIKAAFPAQRPAGFASLVNSKLGDEPLLTDQAFADKLDWTLLEASWIDTAADGYASALSFFSDEAICFYIPAYMVADVQGALRNADPIFHLTHGFDELSQDQVIGGRTPGTWGEYARQRWSHLTPPQALAIVHFLEWTCANDTLAQTARQALKAYWYERAGVQRYHSTMFSTARLIVEPLTAVHAEALESLIDARVNRYFASQDAPTSLAMLRKQFSDLEAAAIIGYDGAHFISLAVKTTKDERYIGRLEALVRGKNAEIAFIFVPNSWGQGYASEATMGLITKLEDLGVERIWACVGPTNTLSLALCSRLNFEQVELPNDFILATYDDGDVVFSLSVMINQQIQIV